MKPIDFDAPYAEFAEKWIRENKNKYPTLEDLERHLPEIYVRFLNQPASWLDGQTPGTYFANQADAAALVSLLVDYEAEGIDVPDPLLERISDLGESAVPHLMALAENPAASEPLRVTALNLMIEIATMAPLSLCLSLVDAREKVDAVADVAAEWLESMGHEAVPHILGRIEAAGDEARATYLDLLCNFPGDERIYTYTMAQFMRDTEQRALYASYLGKLGDERAVPTLRKALHFSDIHYLDYIEIRNAIEQLTGEIVDDLRTFDGDPYYEALKSQ